MTAKKWWKWMAENDSGGRLMTENDGGGRWMVENDNGERWMAENGSSGRKKHGPDSSSSDVGSPGQCQGLPSGYQTVAVPVTYYAWRVQSQASGPGSGYRCA